jgi:two-component system nitrate/nitrite response regulator NarL
MDAKRNGKSETERTHAPLRKVVVVDDFPFTLSGLCEYLQSQPGFQVVGTGTTGDEAVMQTLLLQPDLVLMDLEMPGMNGLTAAQVIRERCPQVTVIIVSVYDTPVWRQASQAHGAHGFVSKNRLHQELLPEIERVMDDRALAVL